MNILRMFIDESAETQYFNSVLTVFVSGHYHLRDGDYAAADVAHLPQDYKYGFTVVAGSKGEG